MDAIDSLGEAGVLSVSVAPSFASKWLLPRLETFQRAHPEIDVHVSASMQLTDFVKDGIDLAIRYGVGRYSDLSVERLLAESVVPVCSPDYLASHGPFTGPDDLVEATLLHDDSPDNDPSCPNWEMWLGTAAARDIDAARDLRLGRLVQPFSSSVKVDFAYYIVAPRPKLNLPTVWFFIDWLRNEAGQEEQQLAVA